MNQLRRNAIRGLYKEAGVPGILESLKNAVTEGAGKVKDVATDIYNKNPELYNSLGVDAASITGLVGGGKLWDMLRGKKTSMGDHVGRGILALLLSRTGQWGYGKYKDMKTTADSAIGRIGDLQKENEEQAKAHKAEKDSLITKHKDDLDNLRAKHEGAIGKLKKALEDEQAAHGSTAMDFTEKLNALQDRYDNTVAEHAQAIENLKQQSIVNEAEAARKATEQAEANEERRLKRAEELNDQSKAVEERRKNDKKSAFLETPFSKGYKQLLKGNTQSDQPSGKRPVSNPVLDILGLGIQQ